MRNLLLCSMFLTAPVYASSKEVEERKEEVQIAYAQFMPDQLVVLKKKRKKRKGGGMVIGSPRTYYNLHLRHKGRLTYLTQLSSREALIAFFSIASEQHYILIDTKGLLKGLSLDSYTDVAQYFKQGKIIAPVDHDKCIICEDRGCEYAADSCGHLAMCGDCVDRLPSPKKCPICRSQPTAYLRIYRR